jgi:hypothetical protein
MRGYRKRKYGPKPPMCLLLAAACHPGQERPRFRRLPEFTRLRAGLVHERTRYWARLEKLLERVLINSRWVRWSS